MRQAQPVPLPQQRSIGALCPPSVSVSRGPLAWPYTVTTGARALLWVCASPGAMGLGSPHHPNTASKYQHPVGSTAFGGENSPALQLPGPSTRDTPAPWKFIGAAPCGRGLRLEPPWDKPLLLRAMPQTGPRPAPGPQPSAPAIPCTWGKETRGDEQESRRAQETPAQPSRGISGSRAPHPSYNQGSVIKHFP